MKRKTIDIITLGCSKNLVDSEHLMRQLEEVGFHVTHDAERPKGQIAVINTCGFIGDAKEESINMILEFAQAKEEGNLEKLYVMGCLSERYLKELAVEIPQVDKFYGKFNWRELLQDLGKAYHDELHIERTLTTPKHYAYLKISEGCDRKCSYCAIPIITGRHVSRPMEEILDEVKYLVARGVKEFQVICWRGCWSGVKFQTIKNIPLATTIFPSRMTGEPSGVSCSGETLSACGSSHPTGCVWWPMAVCLSFPETGSISCTAQSCLLMDKEIFMLPLNS